LHLDLALASCVGSRNHLHNIEIEIEMQYITFH